VTLSMQILPETVVLEDANVSALLFDLNKKAE
jgi:hypothetical protein